MLSCEKFDRQQELVSSVYLLIANGEYRRAGQLIMHQIETYKTSEDFLALDCLLTAFDFTKLDSYTILALIRPTCAMKVALPSYEIVYCSCKAQLLAKYGEAKMRNLLIGMEVL